MPRIFNINEDLNARINNILFDNIPTLVLIFTYTTKINFKAYSKITPVKES